MTEVASMPQDQVQASNASDNTEYMWASQQSTEAHTTNMKEKIAKEIHHWSKIRPSKRTCQVPKDHGMFPTEHNEVRMGGRFKKYNTSLPSSASIERVFSCGSDILRPKRASLASPNFENLVFLKTNMALVDKCKFLQDLGQPMSDEVF